MAAAFVLFRGATASHAVLFRGRGAAAPSRIDCAAVVQWWAAVVPCQWCGSTAVAVATCAHGTAAPVCAGCIAARRACDDAALLRLEVITLTAQGGAA